MKRVWLSLLIFISQIRKGTHWIRLVTLLQSGQNIFLNFAAATTKTMKATTMATTTTSTRTTTIKPTRQLMMHKMPFLSPILYFCRFFFLLHFRLSILAFPVISLHCYYSIQNQPRLHGQLHTMNR